MGRKESNQTNTIVYSFSFSCFFIIHSLDCIVRVGVYIYIYICSALIARHWAKAIPCLKDGNSEFRLTRTQHSETAETSAIKFKNIHRQSMDLWLGENKNITAFNLKSLFIEHFSIDFSLSTIKFHRRALKWTMKRKRYCQLFPHKNKLFRVDWCLRQLSDRDTFKDDIFVDESNIELSSAED